MAVIALIAVDYRQQRAEADRIIDLVESIDPKTPREEVEKLRARTVFHTSFGDIDAAVSAARRLVLIQRTHAPEASLTRALRWQSTSLKLSNNVEGAIASLTESYRLAARLELKHEMWQAALHLQDVAIDCENLDLAVEWTTVAQGLSRSLTISDSRFSNSAYLDSRVAIMQGDIVRAQTLLAQARSTDRPLRRTRAEESLLALDVFLRMQSENAVPRDLLGRLRRLHLRTQGCGVRDFQTGVLVLGLVRAGDKWSAESLYRSYVLARRNRLPPHSALREAECAIA
jgi:hypothetical protein